MQIKRYMIIHNKWIKSEVWTLKKELSCLVDSYDFNKSSLKLL